MVLSGGHSSAGNSGNISLCNMMEPWVELIALWLCENKQHNNI